MKKKHILPTIALIAWLWTGTNAQSQDTISNNSNNNPDKMETVVGKKDQVSKDTFDLLSSGYNKANTTLEKVDSSNLNEVLEKAKEIDIKTYVWWIWTTSFNTDKLWVSSSISIRVWWAMVMPLTDWMFLDSWAILQTDGKDGIVWSGVWLNINPKENLSVSVWNVATPATLHRAHPVSADSHFELSTQAMIPWSALWWKVILSKKWNPKTYISWWVFNRAGNMEFHLSWSTHGVKASVWKNTNQDKPSWALTIKHGWIRSDFVFDKDVIGGSTSTVLKNNMTLWWELWYDTKWKKISRATVWVGKLVKYGLMGAERDPINKKANLYLFIYVTGDKRLSKIEQ